MGSMKHDLFNTVHHQHVLSLFHISFIKHAKKLAEQTHTVPLI